MALFHESRLHGVMSVSMHINGKQNAMYGDSSYVMRPWSQVAFVRANATAERVLLNVAMSAVREAVEWSTKTSSRCGRRRTVCDIFEFATRQFR